MLDKVTFSLSDKIIRFSFYILFFLTPLFFTKFNSELFEFNKMILVYTLTVIITGTWLIKMVNLKSFIVNRTPLDIPLMIFLGSQILSTIFSIDRHTSIWGYYSRSNGGLLSIISYILLYYAFVSNIKKEEVLKFLKAGLFGGLLVSLWAIPEHFGFSPSCAILVQRFAADCWVQNVQDRVFASLGQPNWLAAYLGMLIFPAIYFALTAEKLSQTIRYTLYAAIYYLAFTFTYSRGGSIGFLVGFGVIASFWLVQNRFWSHSVPQKDGFTKPLLLVTSILLLINLLFGSALTGDFKLLKQQAAPARPGITLGGPGGGTQLENGGSESGQIRLIVWKGAIDIFKHYPIFGSGVETFAYSYYQFRPIQHNLTSEWDFLYNKAHNEFINYLATTGIVGFTSYIAVILTFIFWVMGYVFGVISKKQKEPQTPNSLLLTSLLAGYITYLVQNFFGFSVVMIAVLFYLFPAFAFVYTESTKPLKPPKLITHNSSLITLVYRRPLYTNIFRVFLICLILIFIFRVFQNWSADTLYKYGSDYSDAGNPGRAYNYLASAVNLNPKEPLYRSELGFAAASAAVALVDEDSTTSANLKKQAIDQTQKALKIGPKNVSLYRTAIRTYYQLSAIDPEFEEKSINIMDKAISLAPTDPKLHYNKGLILSQIGKKEEAIKAFQKAIELRPIYEEAIKELGELKEEG